MEPLRKGPAELAGGLESDRAALSCQICMTHQKIGKGTSYRKGPAELAGGLESDRAALSFQICMNHHKIGKGTS